GKVLGLEVAADRCVGEDVPRLAICGGVSEGRIESAREVRYSVHDDLIECRRAVQSHRERADGGLRVRSVDGQCLRKTAELQRTIVGETAGDRQAGVRLERSTRDRDRAA